MKDKNGIPIVQAEPRGDFEGGLKVYCDFCKTYHLHGRGEGHREAHCNDPTSPYRKTGYILALEPEKWKE